MIAKKTAMGIALILCTTATTAWSQCEAEGCGTYEEIMSEQHEVSTFGSEKKDLAGSNEQEITTEELKAIVEKNQQVIILDARSEKFDDGRRIPGAKHLASDAEEATIKTMAGSDKNAKIITYCSHTKCPASAKLAKNLREKGYTNVIEYPEGIKGWAEAGNKIVKDENATKSK